MHTTSSHRLYEILCASVPPWFTFAIIRFPPLSPPAGKLETRNSKLETPLSRALAHKIGKNAANCKIISPNHPKLKKMRKNTPTTPPT